MIKFNNVSKKYKDIQVFNDISIDFPTGNTIAIVGENGCGKSVLMKLICGYSKPDIGTVEVFGETLGKRRDFPSDMGILINDPDFIRSYTGLENLTVLSSINHNTNITFRDYLIRIFDMEENIHKKYRTYSLGMKQKLRIIQAFMEEPNLVILDEPFNALDDTSKLVLSNLISEYMNDHRTIIFSSHDNHNIVSLPDIVYEIKNHVLEHVTL